MLDKSAIEAIQEAQAIEQASIAIGGTLRAGIGIAALPQEFKIHDIERFLPNPRRMRASMETSSTEAFAEYAEANKQTGATVFVDADSMRAKAVLDFGTPEVPGHRDNLAVLTLVKAPEYQALTNIDGCVLSQRAFSEFMEDNRGCMKFYNDADEIQFKPAINAIRKMTIESLNRSESEVKDMGASRSTFESVQVNDSANVPTIIYFNCKPYDDLQERLFVCRLGVRTGGKDPELVLRISNMRKHQDEMGRELIKLITNRVAMSAVQGWID